MGPKRSASSASSCARSSAVLRLEMRLYMSNRCRSAAMRRRSQGFLRRHQEIGVGPAVRTPHSPAKLVEIGQTEAIGMVHQNGIRARDVEAVFNESRRRQHVVAALGEFQHDFFEFL